MSVQFQWSFFKQDGRLWYGGGLGITVSTFYKVIIIDLLVFSLTVEWSKN